MVAKKSAPSQYNPPPLRQSRRRSASPMTIDDQLLYIERWGVNQIDGCIECKDEGLGTRCFVASKISPQCGRCLQTGKECHFPKYVELSDEEESDVVEVNKMTTVRENEVVVRQKDEIAVYIF
jgi:hypothetical protein